MPNPPQDIFPTGNCQICNQSGHSARLCMKRGNFGYVASTLVDSMEDFVDENWCLDSRASHHMTLAFDQFYDAQPYSSMNSIIIGDGKVLKITHIGKIRLKTPFGMLDLENASFS